MKMPVCASVNPNPKMMLSTVFSSLHQTLKPPLLPHLKTNSFSRFSLQNHNQIGPSRTCLTKIRSFKPTLTSSFLGFPGNKRLGLSCNRRSGFCVNVESGEGGESKSSDSSVEEDENLARGDSTMPERFRHLTKEAPEPPLRWPWFVAIAFLVYTWRTVLFELSNWGKAAVGIGHFVGYLLKLVLALIFHFVGDPITSLIMCIETAIYTIRAFYSGIVAYTPIRELTVVIMLASAVLAIAEATVPNAVSSQPYLLTVSGLIGYAAVRGFISEPFFWTLLLGIYGFSRLIKKRDDVTSALPIAAVLAAVGEPWVRILAMASYLALAISQHYKKISAGKEELEVLAIDRKVPLPLLGAALAIGIRVAAKWAGYRHLTWMIA